MADNGSATILLIIIAVATSIQTLMLLVGAAYAFRGYRKVTEELESLRRVTSPLIERVSRVLDAVEDTTARVRTLDDNVRHAVAETTEVAKRSVARLKSEWWPVVATGQAALAAFRAFRKPRARKIEPRPELLRRKRTASEDDETRFVYEGGTNARS